MIKNISVVLFGTLFSLNLYSNEIASYSALKYKMDIWLYDWKILELVKIKNKRRNNYDGRIEILKWGELCYNKEKVPKK